MHRSKECADLYAGETKQQLHKNMAQHRRATFLGPDSAVHLHLKEQGHSGDSYVHIVDREDRWFERGVKEAIYVKLEKTSLNRGGGIRYHLPSTYNTALSLTIHTLAEAALFKDTFQCKDISFGYFTSFEYLSYILKGIPKILFLIIYRSPGYCASFIDEFSELLSVILNDFNNFILTGDFNIHIDNMTDGNAKEFSSLLDMFGLWQHVTEPTHLRGHSLDQGHHVQRVRTHKKVGYTLFHVNDQMYQERNDHGNVRCFTPTSGLSYALFYRY